jgi:peptidoglycan/LPS O-acetylase OafA/YrhL
MGIWVLWPARRIEIGEAFTTIADAIATGCLLAGARERLGRSEGYLRFLRSPGFVVVPLAVVVANAFQHYPAIDFLAGQTIMNVAIALTIDRCVRVSGDWVRRLLESRVLAGMGVLSYSLYLWQEPFLNRFARSEVTLFPFNLMLTFAAAAASHYLVERPLMQWRQRLRRVRAIER